VEVTVDTIQALVSQWGYLGILVFVLLGNFGLPIPEESVLWVAGYLVWQGGFQLPLVLLIGIVSAVAGDSLGYWVGRRYGQPIVARYGLWARLTPPRLATMRHFVERYGAVAVFLARFVIGLRFLVGPLAGSLDLPWRAFLTANVLGALVYVPIMVGMGYAVGVGLGGYGELIWRAVVKAQEFLLLGAAMLGVLYLGYRALQRRWNEGRV
jgi:membrane protein DedA with SNARE-associated domain